MAVKVQTYHIRVKFLTETLGLSPASAELYEKYIKNKIYKEIEKIEKALNRKKLTEEEREALEIRLERLKKEADEEANIPEFEERLTVFPRDKKGYLCFWNYQILGFFKEVAHNFFKNGLKNKFSRYCDVWGNLKEKKYREVYLTRNGKKLTQSDSLFERPLRAVTPSGQYIVSLAVSEMLEPPVEMEFYLKVYGDKRLHGIDEALIKDILELGREINGISQWRTAGFGKFETVLFKKVE